MSYQLFMEAAIFGRLILQLSRAVPSGGRGGGGGSCPPGNRGKKCPFCEQVPFFS